MTGRLTTGSGSDRCLVLLSPIPLHCTIFCSSGVGKSCRRCYSEVIIPEAVAAELQQSATPALVRQWIVDPPAWLRVVTAPTGAPDDDLGELDRGERQAILLAVRLKADLVLMDDREGVEEARRLGLSVIGTLGVLDRAARAGLIELASAIARLRQTNFRVDPGLLDRMLTSRHS